MYRSICCVVAVSVLLSACGKPLVVNGKTYPPYGFLNESNARSERVCYEPIFGNVIWGVVLIETVIVPVYFLGWSLFNPVRLADPNGKCGINN